MTYPFLNILENYINFYSFSYCFFVLFQINLQGNIFLKIKSILNWSIQIFPKAAASTNPDVQADMGRHYDEGSGGYRGDDTYDETYDNINGASGDGSGDGKQNKYHNLLRLYLIKFLYYFKVPQPRNRQWVETVVPTKRPQPLLARLPQPK